MVLLSFGLGSCLEGRGSPNKDIRAIPATKATRHRLRARFFPLSRVSPSGSLCLGKGCKLVVFP